MKRNRREHGRIISVETLNRGSTLDADAAAGATSITVEDAGDFDEDGGWLYIGAQVVEFTACDDDTGVITLSDPLTMAGEQGDPVAVYDPLYGEVVDYQLALVELDGEYDNPDPVTAEVAEGVEDLPEGDRGKAGESCVLQRVGDDEWEVVGVGGRPRKSQGVRFHQDNQDATTAETQTINLEHLPIDNSEHLYINGIEYREADGWSRSGQTITVDAALVRANDTIEIEYAYRKGLAGKPISVIVPFGATGWSYKQIATTDDTDYSAPGYDDSAWSTGTAPFGGGGNFPDVPTAWAADKRLWLRRPFPAATGVHITFKVEDFGQVYVNGNLVESVPLAGLGASNIDPPVEIDVPAEFLNPAGNVIAVRCEDEPEMPVDDNTYADLQIRGTLA